jgi:hypothetical protein
LTGQGSDGTSLAGFTLAALAIPGTMGYTKIIGTPVITGLYTILIPMSLFAIFGSSRHLSVGADSATAAVVAAGLAGMAVRGVERVAGAVQPAGAAGGGIHVRRTRSAPWLPRRFSVAHGTHRLSHRGRRAGGAARGFRPVGVAAHHQRAARADCARPAADRRSQSLCGVRLARRAGGDPRWQTDFGQDPGRADRRRRRHWRQLGDGSRGSPRDAGCGTEWSANACPAARRVELGADPEAATDRLCLLCGDSRAERRDVARLRGEVQRPL